MTQSGLAGKFKQVYCLYKPISVNSQSGGQNNKIVLHLKGLFLSGEKTTRLGITEMGLLYQSDAH